MQLFSKACHQLVERERLYVDQTHPHQICCCGWGCVIRVCVVFLVFYCFTFASMHVSYSALFFRFYPQTHFPDCNPPGHN